MELFNHLKPKNLFFADGQKQESLRKKGVEADLCLGIFGETNKTKRVIPNKVYECVAMRKPVVTADTPATRELFEEGELMFVKVADHISLANAIMTLKNNKELADNIAQKGHQKFFKFATPSVLGKTLLKIIQRLLERERIFFNWIKPKTKVLDIAAGNSGLLFLLKKDKMCDVRAFDTSQEAVDAQNNAGVSASAKDVSSDNFNISDKYEFIILSEILN